MTSSLIEPSARAMCVITLGRAYQSHAVQAPNAITQWALFPLAVELEVSLNHVSLGVFHADNYKLEKHLDPTKVTNHTSSKALELCKYSGKFVAGDLTGQLGVLFLE